MAANGNLIFQDTNKATFVGANSNVVIDTVHASFGVGVDVNGPTSNLHVVGNAYVTSNLEVGTANLFVDTVNSRVGVGTTNPQDVTHIWKNGSNDAHGLLIEQNNAGTGSATLKFGVAHASESTAGLSKAGIFFKRAASNGRGDLLFCMDNADDTNDVDTSNHALTIYRDGNVGIGTTSPSSVFNTYGGSLWDGSSMTSKVCATLEVGRGSGSGTAADDTGFGGILEFRHHSDSRFVTIESVSEAAYSASIGLSFKTHGGAADGERMRIAGNGNVGIGTTSPAKKLHVEHYGSAIGDFEGIRIANHASLLHATVRPAYEFVVSDIAAGTGIGNGKFAIGYRGTTSASRTDRLVIDNSGNVGIGTVDPKSVLHVSGDTPKLAIADNTEDDCDVNGFSTGIAFVDNTWNGSMLYSQNPAAGMGFYLGHLSSSSKEVNMKNLTGELSFGTRNEHQAMYIDNDGNVGIGTTSPNWPLEVSAGNDSITYYGPNSSWSSYLAVGAANDKTIANNTAIAQCITTNGNLHLDAAATRDIYMNYYSGAYIRHNGSGLFSDDRLKSEEELITNATDTLLKLSPQKYTKARSLREDESREPFTESGLMAQDVWYDAPELRHLVHLGADANPVDTKPEAPVDGDIQQDPDYSSWGTETAALNYDGLIAYLIKSNQELHARIQALENA